MASQLSTASSSTTTTTTTDASSCPTTIAPTTTPPPPHPPPPPLKIFRSLKKKKKKFIKKLMSGKYDTLSNMSTDINGGWEWGMGVKSKQIEDILHKNMMPIMLEEFKE